MTPTTTPSGLTERERLQKLCDTLMIEVYSPGEAEYEVAKALESRLQTEAKAEPQDMSIEAEAARHMERAAKAEPAAGMPTPERMFPIMGYHDIPWRAIASAEKQARENHGGQTLDRLAERGGLGAAEACAVMQFRPFKKMDEGIAREVLDKLVARELERLSLLQGSSVPAWPTREIEEIAKRTDTPWEVRPYQRGAFIIGAGDETIAARLAPDIAEHIVKCVNLCGQGARKAP